MAREKKVPKTKVVVESSSSGSSSSGSSSSDDQRSDRCVFCVKTLLMFLVYIVCVMFILQFGFNEKRTQEEAKIQEERTS